MEAELLDDAGRFLEKAERLLLADEARNNLLLGIAGNLRDHPGLYDEHRLWLVRDAGRPVAAAARTPPFNLVLARPASDAALLALAEAIDEELPGVTGALPEAERFAVCWQERHRVTARTAMAQGIYSLERVVSPPQPAGAAREAHPGDRELLVDWLIAFAREAVHENDGGPDRAPRVVEHRLSSSTSGLLLWEDGGRPVSLAGWGGRTPGGIRVGPVYTPPELRGRGYATALTAELSQRQLDAGRRFCFLYTDLANPTSNAIYERIGYRRVCESAEIVFDS